MTDRSARILFVASLAVGLVLRLAFVPTAGFPTDVGTFMAWGDRLRELGPGQFYSPDYFSDYPPGFLYVLWLVAMTTQSTSCKSVAVSSVRASTRSSMVTRATAGSW